MTTDSLELLRDCLQRIGKERGLSEDSIWAVLAAIDHMVTRHRPRLGGTAGDLALNIIERADAVDLGFGLVPFIVEVAAQVGLAMRSRRVWISWSWARNVAEILAFSACNAAISAFKSAGSSGRVGAKFDMRPATTKQAE